MRLAQHKMLQTLNNYLSTITHLFGLYHPTVFSIILLFEKLMHCVVMCYIWLTQFWVIKLKRTHFSKTKKLHEHMDGQVA